MRVMARAAMRRQLKDWELAARLDVPDREDLVPAAVERGSLLRRAATEKVITAAEERLDVVFPPSYRLFLSVSNGAYGTPLGAMRGVDVPGIDDTSVPGLGFLAAQDVRWLTDAAPEVIEAYADQAAPGESPVESIEDGTPLVGFGALRTTRALMISSRYQAQLTVLVDTHTSDPDGEWRLWQFDHTDVFGWPSFGAWLAAATTEPSLDAIAEMIRRAHHDDAAEEALRRVRNRRAAPLLIAEVSTWDPTTEWVPGLSRVIFPILGLLRSEDAVPVLQPFLNNASSSFQAADALRNIATPAARDALADAGKFFELCQLNDPRGFQMALDALHGEVPRVSEAARSLGQGPSPEYIPHLLAAWQRAPADKPTLQLSLAAALHHCGAPEGATYLRQVADEYPETSSGPAALRILNAPPIRRTRR